jgi:Zn-dependent M28 family amino/carboxypeptidase
VARRDRRHRQRRRIGGDDGAVRIIKALGLKPRRTIRIGLWGAEEGGLVGSRTYVSEHLGTAQQPKGELAKTSVYFNLDNGTGRIRGVWLQGTWP